jgi:hypothetical protein
MTKQEYFAFVRSPWDKWLDKWADDRINGVPVVIRERAAYLRKHYGAHFTNPSLAGSQVANFYVNSKLSI